MNHRSKGAHLLVATAMFIVAATPAQAQSTLSSYKDALASTPPAPVIQNDIAHLMSTILPSINPPPIQQTPFTQPTPPPKPTTGASGAPGVVDTATIAAMVQKLVEEMRAVSVVQQRAQFAIAAKLVEATDAARRAALATKGNPTAPASPAADFVETKLPGFIAVAALKEEAVNKNAGTLQRWLKEFAADNPAYRAGTRPGWGNVLPTVLSGYYTGSAVAVMPGGASSTGDLTLIVDFMTRDVSGAMNFYSANPDLAGDIEFGGTAQIGGGNHAMAGDIWYSGAFGGVIEDGKWSGGFYGSLADVVAGDWQAAVTGGPNAGLVHGKFGGQR